MKDCIYGAGGGIAGVTPRVLGGGGDAGVTPRILDGGGGVPP